MESGFRATNPFRRSASVRRRFTFQGFLYGEGTCFEEVVDEGSDSKEKTMALRIVPYQSVPSEFRRSEK
jgi:hypothetical protein